MTLDAFDGPGHAEEDLKLLDQIEELVNTMTDSVGRASRLDHMRAAMKYLYTRECAPYLKGDEVVITKTPTAVDAPGWAGVLHLLQPGTRATVESVRLFSNGWSIGVKVADVVGVYCFKPDALKPATNEPPVEEPVVRRPPRVHALLFRKHLSPTRSQYALIAVPTSALHNSPITDLIDLDPRKTAADNALATLTKMAARIGGVREFLDSVSSTTHTRAMAWLPEMVFTVESPLGPSEVLEIMLHLATDRRSVVAGVYSYHPDAKRLVVDIDTEDVPVLKEV